MYVYSSSWIIHIYYSCKIVICEKKQGERFHVLADIHLKPTSSNYKHKASLQLNDTNIRVVSSKTYVYGKHVATRSQELRRLESCFVGFQNIEEWF